MGGGGVQLTGGANVKGCEKIVKKDCVMRFLSSISFTCSINHRQIPRLTNENIFANVFDGFAFAVIFRFFDTSASVYDTTEYLTTFSDSFYRRYSLYTQTELVKENFTWVPFVRKHVDIF